PDLDDVAAALRARDAERDGPRVLAAGVAGAREELAEAAGLDDHRLAALVADDRRLAHDRGGAILPGILRALALGVALAREEVAVLPPLLEHLAEVALLAHEIGLLGRRLPRRELLRLVELLTEALVEALQELHALELTGADLVELLLHL